VELKMSNKFELITFITKSGEGFFEYESIEDYIDNSGDKKFSDVLGFFDKYKDLTIDECLDESSYLICYISSEDGSHLIINANNKFELIAKYNRLLSNGQEIGYINIFNLNDLTYICK
jgi:hypothetical protein